MTGRLKACSNRNAFCCPPNRDVEIDRMLHFADGVETAGDSLRNARRLIDRRRDLLKEDGTPVLVEPEVAGEAA